MTETREVHVRALVAQAAAHDPDAWEALYRLSYPRLFAFARRRVASDERADDGTASYSSDDGSRSFSW